MRTAARVLAAIVVTGLGWGCSVPKFTMTYQSAKTLGVQAGSGPHVAVEQFADVRGEDSDYMGTVRGGYGNPLARVRSVKPVADIVRDMFADALVARDAVVDAEGQRVLSGRIIKLDCATTWGGLSATVEIEVTVTDKESGKALLTKTHRCKEGGGTRGIAVSTVAKGLRDHMERTVRKVIDEALEDPELRAALHP